MAGQVRCFLGDAAFLVFAVLGAQFHQQKRYWRPAATPRLLKKQATLQAVLDAVGIAHPFRESNGAGAGCDFSGGADGAQRPGPAA